jgi:hypothetical protein
MLLKGLAKGQDRRLIRDSITDQLDTDKAAHGGYLDQGLLHRRIIERITMLQKVDALHGRQQANRADFLIA